MSKKNDEEIHATAKEIVREVRIFRAFINHAAGATDVTDWKDVERGMAFAFTMTFLGCRSTAPWRKHPGEQWPAIMEEVLRLYEPDLERPDSTAPSPPATVMKP